jgi:hypothetical protein
VFHLSVAGPKLSEAAFYMVVQPVITPKKTKPAYLDLIPSSISPLGVIRHPISIGESLDPHLDFSGVVKDTAVAIHIILDGRKIEILAGVIEDGLVPIPEVWVVGNEIRKGIPLVCRTDKSGSVWADASR